VVSGKNWGVKEIPNPLNETDFTDFDCPYCGNPISFPKEEIETLKECPNCLESMFVPQLGMRAEKIPFPIKTDRQLIRRLRMLDKEPLSALMCEEVLRFMELEAQTEDEVREWLVEDKQAHFPHRDRDIYFAIESNETGHLIGIVSFWFCYEEGFDTAEFFVLIHPKSQRQGFGAEAVRGVFSYAFDGLQVHRIVAHCDIRNVAAQGLCLKAGMRKESHCLKELRVKGEWVDTVGFGLLREEFEKWEKS
jgi:RimJ/RimL family protein N-acetyltransferase